MVLVFTNFRQFVSVILHQRIAINRAIVANNIFNTSIVVRINYRLNVRAKTIILNKTSNNTGSYLKGNLDFTFHLPFVPHRTVKLYTDVPLLYDT